MLKQVNENVNYSYEVLDYDGANWGLQIDPNYDSICICIIKAYNNIRHCGFFFNAQRIIIL